MHQDNPEYFLVDKRVLPEVFIKVMEVKQRLNTGESTSVNEAVRKTGLSRSAYYKYSGTEVMPFVQSGFPQIFASMGYLGKCTPYILTGEVQGGYTKFAGITSENPQIRNSFNFDVDPGSKVVYSGISNIYNNYSITFEK